MPRNTQTARAKNDNGTDTAGNAYGRAPGKSDDELTRVGPGTPCGEISSALLAADRRGEQRDDDPSDGFASSAKTWFCSGTGRAG